jgi:hypothetical protein
MAMHPATIPIAVLLGVGYYLWSNQSDAADGPKPDQNPYGPPQLPPGMPPQYPPQYPYPLPPQYQAQAPTQAPAPRPSPSPTTIPASTELLQAASNLYATANSPGAACAAVAQATAAFQRQAAADGHRITVDGKYGAGTASLLDGILRRQGLHAPAALWGAGKRCAAAPGASAPVQGSVAASPGGAGHAGQLLRDQMGGPIMAGDTYLANGSYDSAVEAFKAAGHAGVLSVGPATDAQTRGASVTASRSAWLLNGELAKINSKRFNNQASSVADAYRAQQIAHNMYDRYAGALGLAPNLVSGWYTGIGTVIPASAAAPPKRICFDAGSDVRLCAAVASALASETDADKLRAFAATVAGAGFPAAAAALGAKAATLGI